MEESKALFICMTPFQIYFASKIIEKENLGSSASILLIDLTDSDKNYKYLLNAQNETGCQIANYKEVQKYKIGKLISFFTFYFFHFLMKKYDDVYIASLHDKYIHIFLKLISFCNLKSFDDGMANIHEGGIFYTNKYIKNTLIPQISKHYTIYNKFKNVIPVEKLEYIDLFQFDSGLKRIKTETIKIFIGQPYEEFIPDFNLVEFEEVLKNIGINYYFKHPREVGNFYSVSYIQSDDIFEIFLDKYMQKSSHVNIEVYSFLSSVLLNISSVSSLKLGYFYTENTLKNYSNIYKILDSVCDYRVKVD